MKLTYPGGWNALVNPTGEYVAAGRNETFIVSISSGSVDRVLTTIFSRPMGWISDYVLLIQAYEDNCDVITYDLKTGVLTTVNTSQWINMAAAGHGHWVGGCPNGKKVVRDGNSLSTGLDWFCGCDGDWSVILTESNIYVYNQMNFVATYPMSVVRYYATVREGFCGYGRNGPPQILECNTGINTNVNVTNYPVSKIGESEPCYSNDWIATAIERPSPIVAVRPFKDNTIISLPVIEGCVGVDFRRIGDKGIVASWSNRGTMVIQDVDLTVSRHKFEVTPVFTMLNYPALIGGYFVGTYRYGGDNGCKDVFGNCAVVVGEAVAAETLDPCIDGLLRYRVIDISAIPTMAANLDKWNSVAAIYVSAEDTIIPEESVKKQITAARYLMDLYNRPHKPIIPYLTTDLNGLERLARTDPEQMTWPGIQLYLTEGQGPNDLRTMAGYALQQFNDLPVVIIAQAYNRNGTYTGNLTELVPVYHEIAQTLGPLHKGTLAFSYKRPGGIKELVDNATFPLLHETWKAFANSVPRP